MNNDEPQTPQVEVPCTLDSGVVVTVRIPHHEATDKPQPEPSWFDILQSSVGK